MFRWIVFDLLSFCLHPYICSPAVIEIVLSVTYPSNRDARNVIIVSSRMLTGTNSFDEFTKFCMKFTLFASKKQREIDINEEFLVSC